MTTNLKRYIISACVVVSLASGTLFLGLAQANDQQNQNNQPSNTHPKPMIVQIGPEGKTLLRGTVSAVAASSIIVKTWGGDWTVNIGSSTQLTPGGSMSQFKVGDFVGVQGMASTSGTFLIDATLVRNWTAKETEQNNKQEINKLMKEVSPRNWEGTASNTNAAGTSFTLTIDGVAYTINVAANAKVVNRSYFTIGLGDIKNGDTVRVWGPSSNNTITAYVVRDVSIAPQ